MLLKLIMSPFLSYMLLVSLTKIALSSKESLVWYTSWKVISSNLSPHKYFSFLSKLAQCWCIQ